MTTGPIGIAEVARAHPRKAALVAGERRISYGQLDERVNRLARVLLRRGAGPDDRVCVAFRNRPEFFEAAAAAGRIGADVVPVSWRYKADEVRYMVEDSGAKVILAEPGARELTEGLPAIYLDEYEEALGTEDPAPPAEALDPGPVFFRYYTSGTTGRPKAVDRPKPPVEGYVAGVLGYAGMYGVADPEDVHLACGPLYHTAPCAFANYALLLGQTVVVMERFDAEHSLALIDREQVTWSHMVPINFVRILHLPDEVRTRYDLSSVTRILHAAAPCPPDVKWRIMNVFPPDTVWEYYGMTEGLATIISAEEWRRKPGSVGRAAPGLELRILDENGAELPPGEAGLVYVSPTGGVPFRYAGAPEKTEQAYRGELFTVGDMGYLDEEGYLFLTDRKADVIITGGANVYPAEVEAVLFQHPSIADVAVIGIPDDEWGEAVKAVVQPRGPVFEEAVMAFCREHLAHYKCPRSVDFVETLPRDENGKIRKRELRERYWAGRARRI